MQTFIFSEQIELAFHLSYILASAVHGAKASFPYSLEEKKGLKSTSSSWPIYQQMT